MARLSIRSLGASAIFTLGALAASGAECSARADVIYVDDSATAGANTGQSWPDAFTDLQRALAIAKTGDEIRVGQGTYKPAPPGGSREATFSLVDGALMRGGYAGTGSFDPYANDPDVFVTTLSGDLNGDDGPPPFAHSGDNSYHVLTADGVGPTTRVLGVTVTAGHAVNSDPPHDRGGGLTCINNGQPTLSDCDFRLNRTGEAGGAICTQQAALLIERCEFTGNQALMWSSSSRGGAISCDGPTIVDACVFDGNSAFDDAGGVFGPAVLLRSTFSHNHGDDGGAIRSTLLAAKCDFLDNNASFWGGAAHDVAALINCRFLANFAGDSGGAVREMAIAVSCLFSGNSASSHSGAVALTSSDESVAFVNCTFIGNSSYYTIFGGLTSNALRMDVHNCVFWGNHGNGKGSTQSRQVAASPETATIGHTMIQGWDGLFGGVGNHGNDPRFVDADGPDDIYGTADDNPRLRPNSPCIDSGDATLLPPDEFDLDDDGDVTEPLPIDLDGLPRVVGANLDMGAFEFQGIPCPADINGDASVEVDDLRAVISSWGPCVPGEMCNADLNLDFTVSIDDLLAVISAWGPCS